MDLQRVKNIITVMKMAQNEVKQIWILWKKKKSVYLRQ